MRALLAGVGTLGDVLPLVALGLALRDAGHEARLIGSPSGAAVARRWGLPVEEVEPDTEALLAEAAAGGPAVLRSLQARMAGWIDAQHTALEAHAGWADVLVSAAGAHAAGSVADARGLPWRMLQVCAQAIPSPEHPPLPLAPGALPGWLNRGLWWVEDQLTVWPVGPVLDRHRARLGLPPLRSRHAVTAPPGRTWLLEDPELADPPPGVPAVGYWPLPRPPTPLPPQVEAFLDAGPPPVWVGWGSMADPDPARTTGIVRAALGRAGLRAVLGAGVSGLGAGVVDARLLVVDAVDHRALFPRLAAVVHHGGAGTIAVAARAGLPQLALWHLPDQRARGRGLHKRGLGPPPLRFTKLREAELAARLAALTSEASIRWASAQLAAQLGRADRLAEAITRLEAVAAAGQPRAAVAWRALQEPVSTSSSEGSSGGSPTG
ncbi:MAG: hypothetical protein H6739_20525 [Alphaproteobacteria bacterium]|nr:hypothetical protein [Alphaproteobacteria bacterium]